MPFPFQFPRPVDTLGVSDLEPGLNLVVIKGGEVALSGTVVTKPVYGSGDDGWTGGLLKVGGANEAQLLDVYTSGICPAYNGKWVEDTYTVSGPSDLETL